MHLSSNALHVWTLVTERPLQPQRIGQLERFLAPNELARYARFVHEGAREQYLLTRVLVRTLLSRYAPVEPGAWEFECNQHGRPQISGPASAPRFRFNLTNTRGLVACALTGAGDASVEELGVDAEDVERPGDFLNIAESYLAPEEVRALRALPADRQKDRFFAHWTLKEAFLKARGTGLSGSLDDIAFDLDRPPPIRVESSPSLGDDPGAWQFTLSRPTTRHVLATAIRCRNTTFRIETERFAASLPGAG